MKSSSTFFVWILFIFTFSVLNSQQQIASWDFLGRSNESSWPVSSTATGVTAGNLSIASGLTITTISNSFSFRNQDKILLPNAVTGNDYASFTLTPDAQYKITIDSVQLMVYSQNALRTYSLFTSHSGFDPANVLDSIQHNSINGSEWKTLKLTGNAGLTTATEIRIYVHSYELRNGYERVGFHGIDGKDLIVWGKAEFIDTDPPEAPTNLTTTGFSTDYCDLIWNSATDNVGVTSYEVFQDGSSIGTTSDTTFSAIGLSVSTTYSFTVKAIDGDGNISLASDPYEMTTLASEDLTPPSVPQNISASNITMTSLNVSWDASTDNVMVLEYEVFANNTSKGKTNSENISITGLLPGTQYDIEVVAYDISSNASNRSTAIQVTTIKDTEAPTNPSDLTASNVTNVSFDLTWTESTDNHQVDVYTIYLNNTFVDTTSQTSYSVSNLLENTTYTIKVTATDVSGNSSSGAEITQKTLFIVTDPGWALAYDPVNAGVSETNVLLHGTASGYGWNSNWTVQSEPADIPGYNVTKTTPLTYGELITSETYGVGGTGYKTSGRGINTSPEGPFADYLIDGSIGKPGTTIWLSALLRNESNNGYKFGLKTNGGAWGGTELVLISDNSGQWGLSGSLLESPVSSAKNMVLNETIFAVLKMTFNESDTELSLYINPTGLSTNEPATPDVTTTTNAPLAFSGIRFYPGSSANSGAVDEIRFGESYRSVSPIPTPTLNKLTNPVYIWEVSGEQTYNLSGISDGVGGGESININIISRNTSVIPTPALNYTSPASTATLTYTPSTHGESWIVAEVSATNVPGTMVDSFLVEVKNSKINHAPVINPVNRIIAIASGGQQTYKFTGINDGDDFYEQNISISATSGNISLLPDPTVVYTAGEDTAILQFTPAGSAGIVTVEVLLQDDANGTTDGGDNDSTITFEIQIVESYDAFGFIDQFDDNIVNWWANEYNLTEIDNILKVKGNKKTKWVPFGVSLDSPIDISANPYLNITLRTGDLAAPFTLTAYIHDTSGINKNITKRVVPSENYMTLSYDFSDLAIDYVHIDQIFFAVNGTNLTWSGEALIDEVSIGYYAKNFCNFSTINNRTWYINSGPKNILITDIEHVNSFELSGGESLINNVAFSAIENNFCTLSLDLIADATGIDTIKLKGQSETVYVDNEVQFIIEVTDNMKPTISPIADVFAQTGQQKTIIVSGISDGDGVAKQSVTVSATSADESVTGAITSDYIDGQTIAKVSFTPATAGEAVQVTVTVDDGQSTNNQAETSFLVNVYDQLNNVPTFDPIANKDAILTAGKQMITITGISDGDDGTQDLSFSFSSSDEKVLPLSNVSIAYTQGQPNAYLYYTPDTVGETTVKLIITDNGGTAENNGNASDSAQFSLSVLDEPIYGYAFPMDNMNDDDGIWAPNAAYAPLQYVEFGGFSNVMKISFSNKSNWDGIWTNLPVELNLSDNPRISCDIYPVDKDMDFHIYLYDFLGKRNANGAHSERVHALQNQWTHCELDFSEEGYLLDNEGNAIRIDRITDMLINMHTDNFPYPFTKISGTLYIRNLRIGDQAIFLGEGITATIDPIADQNHFYDAAATEKELILTGISNGNQSIENVSISISSTNESVANPQIGQLQPDGNVILSYTPGVEGTAVIEVTVSATDVATTTTSFSINVLSSDPATATELSIDLTQSYQTFRGIGTMIPPSKFAEDFAKNLGATAVRLGIVNTRFEPVNDNDDPNIIDLSKFNRNIFNWNNIRYLMENGVETFFLTIWSPEPWMKDNLSLDMSGPGVTTNNDQTTNKLSYHYYEEYAEYLTAFCMMFKEETGRELDAIGLQNEPAFHEPYASAILDPQRFVELIKVVGARFEAEGISTGFVMPEQVISQTSNSMDQYIDALQNDPIANEYCEFIGTHGYANDGIGDISPDFSTWENLFVNAQEGSFPKELWMTETGAEGETWNQGLGKGGAVHAALEHGSVSLWTSFSSEGQIYDKFGNHTHSYQAYKHFTKFIRPGAIRVSSPAPANFIQTTTFVNDESNGGNIVSVIINGGSTTQTIKMNYSGSNTPTSLDVYTSRELSSFATIEQGIPADQLIILPAKSITTVVGYSDTYALDITNGNGGGTYGPGAVVSIEAGEAPQNESFYRWTGDIQHIEDKYSALTNVVMPASNITLTAEYVQLPKYILTVVKGTGSGDYFAGELITITAGDSTSLYLEFSEWTGNTEYLDDPESTGATVTMPAKNITLTAKYTAMLSSVTFTVTDGSNPIEGADIVVNGKSITTNVNGEATVQLPYKSHEYTVSADNYYNFSGSFTVDEASEAVSVELVFNSLDIHSLANTLIYPNPVADYLKVQIPDATFKTMSVTDMNGKTVLVKNIERGQTEFEINMDGIKPGTYLIRFSGTEGTYQTKIAVE